MESTIVFHELSEEAGLSRVEYCIPEGSKPRWLHQIWASLCLDSFLYLFPASLPQDERNKIIVATLLHDLKSNLLTGHSEIEKLSSMEPAEILERLRDNRYGNYPASFLRRSSATDLFEEISRELETASRLISRRRYCPLIN